jgi:hypothetical protein
MTKTEDQKRKDAELELKKLWAKEKAAYTEWAAKHYELGKKMYAVDKRLKALAKEAGIEIVHITQSGEVEIVVERHTKYL